MNISRKAGAVALVAVALAAFMLGRVTAGESCASWHDRYRDALSRSISYVPGYDTSDERTALAIVESQRPEGCR
jgi:hypothetical protein